MPRSAKLPQPFCPLKTERERLIIKIVEISEPKKASEVQTRWGREIERARRTRSCRQHPLQSGCHAPENQMETISAKEGFLGSPEGVASGEVVAVGVEGEGANDKAPLEDDTGSSSSSDATDLKPVLDGRERLRQVMTSTAFQWTVVALVLLDSALVIGELLLDLGSHGTHTLAPLILHILSLTLLSIFTLEIALKLYAYQLEFFTHKAEVFDAIVVLVALCLDAVYLHADDARTGTGLIIILRMWRVVRIQNAMMLQVRHVADKKLAEERQRRLAVEEEHRRLLEYAASLKEKLKEHSIEFEEDKPARW
ncbi:voltage-gated hydrogen channel 1-like [Penaeus japonicus]|uniref:voltage-gated hydrogen channel 1-like n=1 Tax=Penaeus japonicus TaxID=27405 RepID=UPI001C70CAD8|nr:voltage-gated hydrogen channel 1-like [Penaeus japonicus]